MCFECFPILPLSVYFLQQDLTGFPKNLHWCSHWKSFKSKLLALQIPGTAEFDFASLFNLSSPCSSKWSSQEAGRIKIRPGHSENRDWKTSTTRNPLSPQETLRPPLCQCLPARSQPSSSMSLLMFWFEHSFLTLTYLRFFCSTDCGTKLILHPEWWYHVLTALAPPSMYLPMC